MARNWKDEKGNAINIWGKKEQDMVYHRSLESSIDVPGYINQSKELEVERQLLGVTVGLFTCRQIEKLKRMSIELVKANKELVYDNK